MSKIRRIIFRPETLIYIYFFAFTLFLAITIKFGVAPDETHHYNFIKYYAGKSIDPLLPQQNSDFSLGSVNTEVSYLYHYLMSFIYRLADAIGVGTVIAIKFVNIIFGLGTLIGLNYIAKALKLNKKVRLATIFLIANIPMFMFISASISYDNLVILMSVAAVCLTLNIRTQFTLAKITALTSIVFLGPVVKKAFLPISIVFAGYIIYVAYRHRQAIKKQTLSLHKNNPIKLFLYIGVLLAAMSILSFKYVSNVVNYGSIKPKCNEVLTHEECLNNPIYNRTHSYNERNIQVKPISEDKYLVSWINLMVDRTYGLFGHRDFNNNPAIISLALIATYIFIILFFRKISWKNFKSTVIPILLIFYMLVLLYTNYKSYTKRGDIALAVQGRYAFPVLMPFILFVVSMYNSTLRNKVYQYSAIGIIIMFSIATGPIYILYGINPSWLK